MGRPTRHHGLQPVGTIRRIGPWYRRLTTRLSRRSGFVPGTVGSRPAYRAAPDSSLVGAGHDPPISPPAHGGRIALFIGRTRDVSLEITLGVARGTGSDRSRAIGPAPLSHPICRSLHLNRGDAVVDRLLPCDRHLACMHDTQPSHDRENHRERRDRAKMVRRLRAPRVSRGSETAPTVLANERRILNLFGTIRTRFHSEPASER
jgi:hypothetical protein